MTPKGSVQPSLHSWHCMPNEGLVVRVPFYSFINLTLYFLDHLIIKGTTIAEGKSQGKKESLSGALTTANAVKDAI
jgi:hypothetical protein